MAFVAVKCPNCGASLQMDDSKESCFCSYCGTKVERERININVSGKVIIDQSDRLENIRKLADAAFANQNYSEAYSYYAKMLEISSEDVHASFRKGICAGYLPLSGPNFREREVLSGYACAVRAYASDTAKIGSCTQEFLALAYALSDARLYGSDTAFAGKSAFSVYCLEYISVLKILYNMSRAMPSSQDDKKDGFLSFIRHKCPLADVAYAYPDVHKVNGQLQQYTARSKMPANIRRDAAAIEKSCKADYFELSHVKQQVGALNGGISERKHLVDEYSAKNSAFRDSHPEYVKSLRSITLWGTLLVILLTIIACFIIVALAVYITPFLLLLIPAAIVAAVFIWKKKKAEKISDLETLYLPAELSSLRDRSEQASAELKGLYKSKKSIKLK